MRLLATQRGHLQIDFSKTRLMDELCPIANLVLDGRLSRIAVQLIAQQRDHSSPFVKISQKS
jgi:hypothetical protein